MPINVTGEAEIQRKIKMLENPRRVLRPPMEKSLAILHRDIAPYPSKPSHSTYRRTGTLGRKWVTAIEQGSNFIRGTVGNNTPYADFVQGLKQTGFHAATGWKRADKVLEEKQAQITGFFKDAIDGALR